MKQRTMDEMIDYIYQEVDKMNINRKYKMAIFGMIDAIDYQNKKQESSAGHEPERKTGRWIERFDIWDDILQYECSVCGKLWVLNDGTPKNNEMNYCPKCGAKMGEIT